jgi:hypothetical protein
MKKRGLNLALGRPQYHPLQSYDFETWSRNVRKEGPHKESLVSTSSLNLYISLLNHKEEQDTYEIINRI